MIRWKVILPTILSVICAASWWLPADAAETVQELYQQGEAAYQKGEFDNAIKYFEQAVEVNPNFAPLYNALGLARSGRNDPLSDVIWSFNVATDIDPKYAEAYDNKCRVLFRANKHDQAEESCRKALAINPNLGSAQLNLAWVYLIGKKQPQDAIFYFQQVLEKTKNPMVYFGLGIAYSMKGDSAHVLDIITTLRGMGENNLATQLEDGIRKVDEPPPDLGAGTPLPEQQPGTLIKAAPEEPVQLPPPENSDDGAGVMRIRLKGKLTTVTSESSPAVAAPPVKTHPGSLSPVN